MMTIPKLDDSLMEGATNFESGGFTGFEVGEIQRFTDVETKFAGFGKPLSLGPSTMGTVQITGNDGVIRSSEHQTGTRFEVSDFTTRGPGSLGKDDENIPIVFQEHSTGLKALTGIGKPVERESVDHYGSNHESVDIDEEVVLSRSGEGAM